MNPVRHISRIFPRPAGIQQPAFSRPRKCQPRHGRKDSGSSGTSWRPATPQQAAGIVPSLHQVVPGASVFIVLKKDQPTGKETAGKVAQLLTRGNHPRGIKVRLQNGQVGRVQRMGVEATAQIPAAGISNKTTQPTRLRHRSIDVRIDLNHPSEPQSRISAGTSQLVMNRPRNRQPRHGPKDSGYSGTPWRPGTAQQAAGTVPSLRQVVPGASVFIILKEDQPTGKETAGVVAQVLTRGNHPRGIKVRLHDGQVGRVQRMGADATAQIPATAMSNKTARPTRPSHQYTDIRNDLEHPSEPPSRSLAAFFPPSPGESASEQLTAERAVTSAYVAVRCPMCDSFEGDETAVTYHIEREHLS
ncbi:hypothetical protein E4U19_000726 [Claviceps sp. Clav32 group G5]|nr:hypothetical protein E4U19_000726 [Claviceps sp. Clav32 group G5]KAG6047627.1 hypothetical protein E4U39_000263 [Claviceps sp. Clav50 group G5]